MDVRGRSSGGNRDLERQPCCYNVTSHAQSLGFYPQHPSKASTAPAGNSSTQEVKAGESEVQGHSQGHMRFQAMVYNKRPYRTGQKGEEGRWRSGEEKRSPSLDA